MDLLQLFVHMLSVHGKSYKWKNFKEYQKILHDHIDGLVHDSSNSNTNALELLHSCSEQSIYNRHSLD